MPANEPPPRAAAAAADSGAAPQDPASPEPKNPAPEPGAEIVASKVRKILEAERLPPEKAERVTEEIVEVAMLWRGPLPPPSTLREYDEIVPGAAKAIIDGFTAEISNNQLLQRWEAKLTAAGLAIGGFVTILMVAVAIYALYLGHEAVAAVIVGVLATVAGVFVWRRSEPPQRPPPPPPAETARRDRDRSRRGR